MRSNRILSTVFVIVACCTFTATALTRADLPVVGTGISGISYHMIQWIFADVAGIWWKFDGVTGQQCWQDKNSQNAVQYEFDEDNYPLSLPEGDYVQCYPFRHNGGLYPTGEYVLTWEGDGDIELRTNVTLVSSTANRKVYNCVFFHNAKYPGCDKIDN